MAWDRFTGEKVWQAEDTVIGLFSAMACKEKLIFTNSMGGMNCYKWETAYTSPDENE